MGRMGEAQVLQGLLHCRKAQGDRESFEQVWAKFKDLGRPTRRAGLREVTACVRSIYPPDRKSVV